MFRIVNHSLRIKDEIVWVYNERGFVDLVRECMGDDAAELLQKVLDAAVDDETLDRLRAAESIIYEVINELDD